MLLFDSRSMGISDTGQAPPKASALAIAEYFGTLQKRCSEILEESVRGSNALSMGRSRQFQLELSTWQQTLSQRRESSLIRTAASEYEFALLALAQGHYRHAFKGLRLVLELCLQSLALSVNELCLREWLDNRRDTVWASILDSDGGVFTRKFAQAFFPELQGHVQHYSGMAQNIYRECSECVHGNVPKHVLLPAALSFDKSVFDLWHDKAVIVARIIHFGLCLRYLADLTESEISNLEPTLSERLGHLPEIRDRLGGPVK
ncbi:MAG TPA: hypothetical protein VEH27_16800 [Methylomirabilota bacterium]|nr:hypothetical protein [Methylomirabilota bacterium]